MDTSIIFSFLQESLFLIIVFGVFFIFALKKGRQTVTNIILGLYFALLLSLEFPYYGVFMSAGANDGTESMVRLILFGVFAVISTLMFARILPREYDEGSFEGLGRKILLAAGGTILVMIFSYHVLPVTDIITPGSPINFLFGTAETFFWWLLAPVVILFLT